MYLSKLQAGLTFLLFVLLLTGSASALSDDDSIVTQDPPHQPEGDRTPILLVLDEQPQQLKPLNQLKADSMTLDQLAAIPGVGHSATDYEATSENNLAYTTISSYVNPTARIELPKGVVLVPGTTYNLPIIVLGVSDLAAYQIDLTFDGSILEVVDVIPGSLGIMAKNIRTESVSFNGAALSGASGNVTIATIRFNATGTTGGGTALDMAAGLWDASTLPIPVEIVSGSVRLLLYGDANEDGHVDQADTLRVLKWVVGLGLGDKPVSGTPGFLAADVNQNGAIDVGDAMLIAQYNVGLRDVWFELTE